MSNVTSEDIQEWIKNRYDNKYHVLAEKIHGRNYLPDKGRNLYRPDILLKDYNGNINYIIEAEIGPTTAAGRKSVVGATILADYCIGILNQEIKPYLFFIVAVKDFNSIKTRVDIAKSYCSNLNQVEVYLWDNFQQLTL